MTTKYLLSFPNPYTHYANIEINISEITNNELFLKMAVWTPGSYLIREFQKNIDFVECIINGQTQRLEKQDKCTWKVNTNGANSLTIRYNIYCFEYSVRTNFVEDTHAFINGAATFLYIDGFENQETEITIKPHPTWSNISNTLPHSNGNKWIRYAKNITELIDSPFEIGNHISYFFEAAGVSHELAIYGNGNFEIEKLIHDLKKIIVTTVDIFGGHPCKDYLFIIHNTDNSYGGLEHSYCSVNHITRWSYDKDNYQQAISLLAHEYFHLWNVKRIRPQTFIPFNYNTENYTDLLWFFEGVTSYYDDYICYRAGVTTLDDYITIVEKNINNVLNTAGADTQTLAEASFDTWLKYYRRNENSNNAQINYYTQGALVAMVFDFILIHSSNGEKNFDDILKILYNNYLLQPNKGITEKNILDIFETVSGLSFSTYFQQFIHTTQLPNIEFYAELLGINIINKTQKETIYLGMMSQWKEGKLYITQLDKNYGAYTGGLNVNDEIIAIDGIRINTDYNKIYAHKKVNDTIDVLISRQGIIKSYKISLTEDNRINIKLEWNKQQNEQQKARIKKWLG